MNKMMWVKLGPLSEVECFCEDRKVCSKELKPECKEYIVKFIEVDRTLVDKVDEEMELLEAYQRELKKSYRENKKLISNLEKGLKKIKFRI